MPYSRTWNKMPLYTFQHPDTEEVLDVVQSMTEKHFYIDENGVEWRRVWHNPTSGTLLGRPEKSERRRTVGIGFNKNGLRTIVRAEKG